MQKIKKIKKLNNYVSDIAKSNQGMIMHSTGIEVLKCWVTVLVGSFSKSRCGIRLGSELSGRFHAGKSHGNNSDGTKFIHVE